MDPDSAPRPPTPPGAASADVAGTDRSRSAAQKHANAAATLDQLKDEFRTELEVIRHIGDESFGSLFLAREVRLRRHVVIKVLHAEFVDNTEARLRFEREARAAAGISHPGVVAVFRVGTLRNGVPFFIEPYMGDCTLSERLASVGRFQPVEVREILLQLAGALEAAHSHGIVHRDVRPETVRCVEASGRVLLTDFGIAGILESAGLDEERITLTGQIVGSAGYMSPEQMNGMPATDRSDSYSLGVLGWRLLAGVSASIPPVGERMDRAALLSLAPDDTELVDLIARCLRQQPDDRPSAAEILRALEPAARTGGIRRGQSGDAVSELIDRWVPYLAILLITVALSATGWLLDWFQSPPRERWLTGVLIVAAFLAALVITWFHGKKGRQAVTKMEILILSGLAVLWFAASALIWIVVAPG